MNPKQNAGQKKVRTKRDSGLPGGGKGRKDEVKSSGVYPMSSPEGASPDAITQGEASFGQGERGAAGYEDHGDLELFIFGKKEQSKK
ncbi:MAG: hypothetical protein AB1489_28290 [Acidobacteriota bacterium]